MLAVIPHLGENIPGCRDDRRLKDVTHNWRMNANRVLYVDAASAYNAALQMWRAGIPAGPSSGAALLGLCDYLIGMNTEGTLASLRGCDGKIHCIFPCPDTLSPYWNEVRRFGSNVQNPIRIAS
jgi:cysteine synthase